MEVLDSNLAAPRRLLHLFVGVSVPFAAKNRLDGFADDLWRPSLFVVGFARWGRASSAAFCLLSDEAVSEGVPVLRLTSNPRGPAGAGSSSRSRRGSVRSAFAFERFPSLFSKSIGLTLCGIVEDPVSPSTASCPR